MKKEEKEGEEEEGEDIDNIVLPDKKVEMVVCQYC